MLQIIVQPSPQVANHLIINTVQRIQEEVLDQMRKM